MIGSSHVWVDADDGAEFDEAAYDWADVLER